MKKYRQIVSEVKKFDTALSIDMKDITPSAKAKTMANKVSKLMKTGMGSSEAIDSLLYPIVKGKKTAMFGKPGTAGKYRRDILNILGLSEAVKTADIKKALDGSRIKYKSIKNSEGEEFEIVSGVANKTGKKWDTYEDSVYKALKKGGVDLSGDASVFIN